MRAVAGEFCSCLPLKAQWAATVEEHAWVSVASSNNVGGHEGAVFPGAAHSSGRKRNTHHSQKVRLLVERQSQSCVFGMFDGLAPANGGPPLHGRGHEGPRCREWSSAPALRYPHSASSLSGEL
jgi:hypothetical protein